MKYKVKPEQINILWRMVIFFFAVIALAVFITFAYNYVSVKNQVNSELRQKSRYLLFGISKELSSLENRFVSTSNETIDIINIKDIVFTPDGLTKLMQDILKHDPDLYGMGIVYRNNGLSLNRYFYKSGNTIRERSIKGIFHKLHQRIKNKPWFLLPRETKKVFISEPALNKLGNREYMITFSSPIFSDDQKSKFAGVLIFDISLERLTKDIILKLGLKNNIRISVITNNGDVLFNNKGRNIKNIFDIANSKNSSLDEQLDYKIGQDLLKYIKTGSNSDNYKLYSVSGHLFNTCITSIFGKNATLLITMDETNVIQQLNILFKTHLFIILIILLFLFVLTYIVLRKTLNPVLSITDSIKEISKGDFDVEIKTKTNIRELLELKNAVKQMQVHLKKYMHFKEDKAKLERELIIASHIQSDLLPENKYKDNKCFEIADLFIPAKKVGGDLYDYCLIDEDHLFLSIGDVSGKGIPPSIFSVFTLCFQKAFLSETNDPAKLLKNINIELNKVNKLNLLVTYFCMVINIKTGKFKYANAGHNIPFIIRKDKKIEKLQICNGIVLGVFENAEYICKEGELQHGDKIVLYTDGITEARNKNMEFFEESRFIEVLNLPADSLSDLIDNVNRSVSDFSKDYKQVDDITLLVLKLI